MACCTILSFLDHLAFKKGTCPCSDTGLAFLSLISELCILGQELAEVCAKSAGGGERQPEVFGKTRIKVRLCVES